MAELKNLQQLLKHELEDLYSAEEQIIEALPSMIETAKDSLLKKALNDHLKVTRKQKDRLDRVKKMLGAEKKENMNLFQRLFSKGEGGKHCRAMEGLIEEGKKMMEEEMEPHVMDAAIIASAQKIEHYEISGYGTAKAYAIQLGLSKVATLINETLNEEYGSDDLLTKLAVGKVNLQANHQAVKGLRKIPGKKSAAKKSTGSEKNSKPAKSSNKLAKATVSKTARKKSSR